MSRHIWHSGSSSVVLDGEDIGHLAVVALRPPVRTVGGVNELRCHTDTATGAAGAAFEHVCDAEAVRDPADVLILPLERKCGRTGNHLETAHLCQSVDDLFGETVTEVLVVCISRSDGQTAARRWTSSHRRWRASGGAALA
jgi:hypothetical protein